MTPLRRLWSPIQMERRLRYIGRWSWERTALKHCFLVGVFVLKWLHCGFCSANRMVHGMRCHRHTPLARSLENSKQSEMGRRSRSAAWILRREWIPGAWGPSGWWMVATDTQDDSANPDGWLIFQATCPKAAGSAKPAQGERPSPGRPRSADCTVNCLPQMNQCKRQGSR